MIPYWARSVDEVLAELGAQRAGLTSDEARTRLAHLPRHRRAVRPAWRTLAAQFLNPLVLILVVAAILSVATGDRTDAIIILAIVALTGGIGFLQERSADRAVARLLASIRTRARVRRDGGVTEVPIDEVVPGDVVLVATGSMVPGDGRLLRAASLQVDEAPLTGESFPVEKSTDAVAADAPLTSRSSMVHQGTHVVSGSGEVLVVATGEATEVGRIGRHLARPRLPTEFARGLARFGNLLAIVSLVLVFAIFTINLVLERPVLDSLLFSVALAVGLVPELLPAIVSVNLARGAHRMARYDVIVRRLVAIEDFGAVDVLCADKTGTLTEGHVRLHAALAPDGTESTRLRELAWVNATFESGYANPMDEALRRSHRADPSRWHLVGEIPYDFVRKRLSVVVDEGGRRLVITKGQVESVLEMCSAVGGEDGLERVLALHRDLGGEGLRTLGVAVKEVPPGAEVTRDLEHEATFLGLLAFEDPVKDDVADVLRELDELGVALKVLTGDDRHVAAHVWRALRGADPVVMTGRELLETSSAALDVLAKQVDVFAEVLPAQKERIVHALRNGGGVVGFLGDGINDAPALRIADVGISVDSAADVAREAADLVLRRRELAVVVNGIREGRRTMVNTLKYVHYTTSANFGNMVSMAIASLFLPFLPLLPKQILLNNLLSDLPALTIASDTVDPEDTAQPRRWRTPEIRRFMIVFGLLSSVFDVAMFGALFSLTSATAEHFRSGWFVGSVLTEVLVLMALRTRRFALASRPSAVMLLAVTLVGTGVVALPYVRPLAALFGLIPPAPAVLAAVLGISVAFVLTTEVVKHFFYRLGHGASS